MLQLRPNCELCDKDLAPAAKDAMICSYECTFCKDCVDTVLHNVCPNCGGNFCARPIRPKMAWRENTSLAHQPAWAKRVNTGLSPKEIHEFCFSVKDTPIQQR